MYTKHIRSREHKVGLSGPRHPVLLFDRLPYPTAYRLSHPFRCCTWLEDNVEGQRVLDYGSGSGILGLAALSFGAKEVS